MLQHVLGTDLGITAHMDAGRIETGRDLVQILDLARCRSASVSGLSEITCNRTSSAPDFAAMSLARSSLLSLWSEPPRATMIRSI
jgi:hypothetical protein